MKFDMALFQFIFVIWGIASVNGICQSIVDCSTVPCHNVTSCPEGQVLEPAQGGRCGKCCSYCQSGESHYAGQSLTLRATEQLPSQVDFLAQLLNVSTNRITAIAKGFKFVTKIVASNLKIYVWKSDGTYDSYPMDNCSAINFNFSCSSNVVLIHGWMSNGSLPWVKEMAIRYLETGVCVISYDWSVLAKTDYLTASTLTKAVGEKLAEIIVCKIQSNTTLLKNIEVNGHSLGAHVAGFCGKKVFKLIAEKVRKVRGFDSAGPLFDYPVQRACSQRFCKTDGVFTENYFTNMGLEGSVHAFAQNNFFVNQGGPIQPGCHTSLLVIPNIQCSHQYVVQKFWPKTINSTDYKCVKCTSSAAAKSGLCSTGPTFIYGAESNTDGQEGSYLGHTDEIGNPISA